jgi:acetate kinase
LGKIVVGGEPVKILVLNCGGSSIKFKIFTLPSLEVCLSGHLERVGTENSILEIDGAKKMRWEGATSDHAHGLERI